MIITLSLFLLTITCFVLSHRFRIKIETKYVDENGQIQSRQSYYRRNWLLNLGFVFFIIFMVFFYLGYLTLDFV